MIWIIQLSMQLHKYYEKNKIASNFMKVKTRYDTLMKILLLIDKYSCKHSPGSTGKFVNC